MKVYLIIGIISVAIIVHSVSAQNNHYPSEILSTGNYALYAGEQIVFHPGSLAVQNKMRFDVCYSRPFNMKELDVRTALFASPLKNLYYILNVTSFGGELYNEQTVSVGSVYPFFRNIKLSTECSALKTSVSGYRSLSDYSVTGGIFVYWSRSQLGARIINCKSWGTAHTSTLQSEAVNIQTSLALTKSFRITAGYLKEEKFPGTGVFESGLSIIDGITFVAHTGYNPSYYGGGIEIKKKWLLIDYHIKEHLELGTTLQCGISFILK
jgi:hypothetical protein